MSRIKTKLVLLPCPFCGGPARLDKHDVCADDELPEPFYFAGCSRDTRSHAKRGNMCKVIAKSMGHTPEQAVAFWNRRKA